MSNKLATLLIDYYKWIVSLSTFIITTSIGIISISKISFEYELTLIIGILCLGVSIIFNILVIKRIITALVISEKDEHTSIDTMHINTMENLKRYGFLQNGCFFIGILIVIVFFLVNLI